MAVLVQSFSSSLCLCGWGGHGCNGAVLLLLTLLGAGEEEAMVVLMSSMVVLELSFSLSSLCLMRVRRRPWLCWCRPPTLHSAWCG
jgi:hypothetical protein